MVVLDASALLALLLQEPGGDRVAAVLDDAVMSTANLAEVLGKAADRGLDVAVQRRLIDGLGIDYVDVSAEDATISGELRRVETTAGGPPVLSLADRLCLALARRLDVPVLTADQAWSRVGDQVELVLLR